MKKQTKEMPEEQKKIAIRLATTNILRTIVLLKRADNTLTFTMRSLEGTEKDSMSSVVWNAKCSIEDVIERLEKYVEK